jgi:hypothetical protein
MKLKIELEMRSVAFANNGASEAARILRVLADKLESGGLVSVPTELHDVYGLSVGKVRFS